MQNNSQGLKSTQNFFRTVQAGDLTLFNIILQGIAMFGFTKTGKTTSSHFLINSPLKAQKIYGQLIYLLATQKYSNAKIGNNSQSQTEIPNIFQAKFKTRNNVNVQIAVLDQPGYGDSYGFHRILSNGYFHYRTFSKTPKLKFILAIKKGDLEGIGEKFKKTIQNFIETFARYQTIKADIMKATVILVTQVDLTLDIEYVRDKIRKLQQVNHNMTTRERLIFQQFIEHMLEGDKIFMIKKPQGENYQTRQNNLLRDICQKTAFWQRKTLNGIVDMSQINFSVAADIINPLFSGNEKFKQDFEYFMTYMDKRTKSILYQHEHSFKKIIDQIRKDAVVNCDSHNFLLKMFQFNQIYYKFQADYAAIRERTETNLFKTEDQDSRLMYFNKKFKFLEYFKEKSKQIWKIFDANSIVRSVQELQHISQTFISISKKMNILKIQIQDSPKIINKYNYVIQRLIEQSKIISLILYSNKEVKVKFNDFKKGMVDIFRPLMDEVFKQNVQDQVQPMKIVFAKKIDTFKIVGLQVINFLEPLLSFGQDDIKFIIADNIIKYATKIKEKNTLQQQKKYLIEKSLFYRTSFYNYLQNIVQDNSPPSLQIKKCIDTIFKLSRILGNLLLGFSQYELAREAFKSIQSASNVLNIFEIQSKTKDSKQHFLQYAKYAKQYQRKELAIQCYQQAFARAQGYEELQRISNLILLLSQTQNLTINQGTYLNNLKNKFFCEDLSDNAKSKIKQKYSGSNLKSQYLP